MRKMQDLSLDDQGDVSIITERDIWVSAGIFIRTYGDAAGIEAARRADDYLSDGDIAGHAMWKRIVVAIKKMTNMIDGAANKSLLRQQH